jgi:hypothetical protein
MLAMQLPVGIRARRQIVPVHTGGALRWQLLGDVAVNRLGERATASLHRSEVLALDHLGFESWPSARQAGELGSSPCG